MAWNLLRSLLFTLDPETAHNLALAAVAKGAVRAPQISLPVSAFGVTFPNPVGLAAGFDKNGIALNQWRQLGFGFVEVGTVTRHAQPGNPKPRMFRLPESKAIINRLGFNNEGADALAQRLERADPGIPVGINLGKSKITPLEEAAEDYAYSFQRLRAYGQYFVVNVSSPNTPGLRSLQDKGPLTKILWRLREIDAHAPLLVKIAPDLDESGLEDVLEVARDFQLAGLIATNTTLRRDVLPRDPQIEGGLSGAPLRDRADEVLGYLRKHGPEDLTLIGVGGIMNGQDARRKRALGAQLVQVYSGWVYGGPRFIPELVTALSEAADGPVR